MKIRLEQKHKIMISIHFISAFALVLFWSGYYLLPVFQTALPSYYSDFAHALPFPDALLVLLAVGAGVLTLRRNKAGHLFTVLCAGVMIFLGIVGCAIELKSGVKLVSMVSMLKSGFINLWCVVFGLYFLLKLKDRKQPELTRQQSADPP
jgi:hydrogenase/urease accessory protein HupE